MFSKYKNVTVNLVFPTSVFGVGISFRLRLFLIVVYLYPFSEKLLALQLSIVDDFLYWYMYYIDKNLTQRYKSVFCNNEKINN